MSFNVIHPNPKGMSSEKRDEMHQLAKPLTPKSERPRATYGSLSMSVQTVDGLCKKTRKCVQKHGHKQPCWPGD